MMNNDDDNNNKYENMIHACLTDAVSEKGDSYKPPVKINDWIETLINSGTKGVLAVIITSLLKKSVDPNQDVRFHQTDIPGGYSGRTLDTKIVTPFLKSNGFPAMAESGWLTRSFEQKVPYDLNYTGAISGRGIKDAFLNILDVVEQNDDNDVIDARSLLTHIFKRLVERRELERIYLARPVGLTINKISKRLADHFTHGGHGKARLPQLAIYAAYQQMVGPKGEVSRYKHMELNGLKSHTAADSRAGATGDIEVIDPETQSVFEAVEIKHNIIITADMIRTAYDKFKRQQVKRYYLLSTATTPPDNFNEITKEIIRIDKEHGCQVIVNGVLDTIKYYLRLLNNPDDFIAKYVTLVENDADITYEHKMAWNNAVNSMD